MTDEANLGLCFCLAAGPSNRDQTETGGVCKEGKSTQDQGASFPSKLRRVALEQGFHTVSVVNDTLKRSTVCSQITISLLIFGLICMYHRELEMHFSWRTKRSWTSLSWCRSLNRNSCFASWSALIGMRKTRSASCLPGRPRVPGSLDFSGRLQRGITPNPPSLWVTTSSAPHRVRTD